MLLHIAIRDCLEEKEENGGAGSRATVFKIRHKGKLLFVNSCRSFEDKPIATMWCEPPKTLAEPVVRCFLMKH